MDFSLVYLINRFFYRFIDFFHHWYVDGSRWFGRHVLRLFMDLDTTFAVKVTAQHFFEPLYKDYTVMGRILGAIFRALRVIVGLLVYVIVGVIAGAIYLAWLLMPAYVLFRIIKG